MKNTIKVEVQNLKILFAGVVVSLAIHLGIVIGVGSLNAYVPPKIINIPIKIQSATPIPVITPTPIATPILEKIATPPPIVRKAKPREDLRKIKEPPKEVEVRGGLNDSTALPGTGNPTGPAVPLGNSAEVAVDPSKANLPPPPAVAPRDDSEPFKIPVAEAAVDVPAKCQNISEIQITDEAANAGITSGEIQVEFIVTSEGVVEKAKIRKGIGFGLDERALDAVKKFQCSAAKKGNNAQAVKKIHKFVILF